MSAIILIPARYASTRYPGKPLAELRGPDGAKSLIQRSWERACEVLPKALVYVCTDDTRIEAAAKGFGAQVIMTSETCRNGTERCANAVMRAGLEAEIIVNLQGDAPLTPPWFVSALIEAIEGDAAMSVATPVLRCSHDILKKFLEDRRANRVGGTTAVFGAEGQGLYFSKEVIPYIGNLSEEAAIPVFHHVGVYAYRRHALVAYAQAPEGALETLEGLEQLRFLENGIGVQCVEVEARGRVFWELNNPVDIARIEAVLNGEWHENG